MKSFTDSKWLGIKLVSSKQICTLVKQIICWFTIVIVLFCNMMPLHGICSCDACNCSGSIDSKLINVNSSSDTCVSSSCCQQCDKDYVFDFCTCICTDSPKPFNPNSNQLLKLQQKDRFLNSFTLQFLKSILPAVPLVVSKINVGMFDYSEFYNSPHSRLTTRIHLILNVWQN
jgi:hypothetical protein